MKAMNKKVLKAVLARPQICARARERVCDGRITIEHAFGRKYEAEWNCILLCEKHHSVGTWQNGGLLDKKINKFHAYQQATEEDLKKFALYDQMKQEKKWLQSQNYPENNI